MCKVRTALNIEVIETATFFSAEFVMHSDVRKLIPLEIQSIHEKFMVMLLY